MTSFSAPALQPTAARARATAAPADLGTILARIEEAVETETAAIRTDMNFDIAASNARKSRHLYDLTRAIRGQDDAALVATYRPAIERLRDKLAVNQGVIVAHLEAVTEVATLVKTALQDAEADGTYSQAEFPEVKRR
jgi:seryl-tRNA(Sec) selenium transferase